MTRTRLHAPFVARAVRLLAAWTLCSAGIFAFAGASSAGIGVARGGRGVVRIGEKPTLPAGTEAAGAVVPSERLQVTIALKPRDPAGLLRYASAVSDPGSSLYGHYLSVRAFARRFGPARATDAAVERSLRSEGLAPGAVSANGLSIPVLASAAALEHAFSLTLADVRLSSGRRALVATSAPAVQRSIAADIQAVVGLNGLEHPQPSHIFSHGLLARDRSQVATGGPQPCASARSAASDQGAYTADQIASAYGFSGLYRQADEGQGVTVALYELEPDSPSDIATYQRCYGTHVSISYVSVDGGAGSGAGSGEAALDIEQVIGLAPRTRLIVYQGPNSNADNPGSGPYDVDSAIVSQDRASVVSTSWGECEPLEGRTDATAEDTLMQEAAVQGQTIVAAAGDSGSEDCDASALSGQVSVPDYHLEVDDPASQPFVTGAGGTTLTALGPPPRETVWNDGDNASGLLGVAAGAGGGGISTFWRMPSYQSLAPAGLRVVQTHSSGAPCAYTAGRCREVPDVSADADPNTPYLVYYDGSSVDGGWQGIGGTSAAAPLWAALIATADASRACARIRLGFVNPDLYRIASRNQAAYFNDVTAGNNDYTDSNGGLYPAGRGYDMASGLGTPKAAALAPALCRQGLRLAAPAEQRTAVGRRVSLTIRVSDASGAGLRLTARKLPPGLRLRFAKARITGRPKRAGTYEVTLTARDLGGGVRTAEFKWIVKRAAVAHVRARHIRRRRRASR